MTAGGVDDIWAEMQREQRAAARATASRPAARTVVTAVDLSSLQRSRPKKAVPKKAADPTLQWMKGWSTEASPDARDGPAKGEEDPLRMTEPPATLMDIREDIPSDTPETFLAYMQRDINCLGEDALGVRLQSLQKLERVLVRRIDDLSTDIVDAVLDALLKPLLKRFKDKSEKCRELAVKVMRSLIENASELSAALPYVFSTLVARLGSEDLDGVAHLPEVARPDPEQKPVEIVRPVEESEEVRLELGRLVASLLPRCNQMQVYSYVDEATGLLRAQAMDPFHEVKALACETMMSFCHNHTEMLLHFSEPLGRSLTSCMTHNHAKIRILALRALTAVLYCGIWKHNHPIFCILMAWQDPNKVPIKAFYEPVTSVNYMSNYSFDRHPTVRRFWFETLAYWLLQLPDKVDHEPYIFPYLLTGLCDENDDIALQCFWLIEKCGELYEAEKEEDLRKTRQYGFDYGWTYEGRAFVPFPLQGIWAGGGVSGVRRTAAQGPDFMGEHERNEHKLRDTLEAAADEDFGEEVTIPEREYSWPHLRDMRAYRKLPRPRLGARHWVRTHTRRYIKATFNDVVDFRDCTALNAGRLLCMSIAYTEEGVTEWLQPMLQALCKFYSGRAWAAGDSQAMRTYDTVCKLLGAYLDPISYWEQLKSAFDAGSTFGLDQRVAQLRILALCLEGSVETLQSVEPADPTLGMGRLSAVIPELISALHGSDLLLSPTPESRRLLWTLVFSFLEPLRPQLSSAQVSQLLFVVLALSAKPEPDVAAELAGSALPEAPQPEDEEIEDSEQLQRALACLSTGFGGGPAAAAFALDDLDDVPGPTADVTVDPRVAHLPLFEHAFSEVLEHLEDSFPVFRSVVYLTPLSVLTSARHSDAVLGRLSSFCSPPSAPAARAAGHALAVHLALRCAKLLDHSDCHSTLALDARSFAQRAFQLMAEGQMDGCADTKHLSKTVVVSGIVLWRRFFLYPGVDPRIVLFSSIRGEPSKPLQWLTSVFADQELYKKFHRALEQAEVAAKGRDPNGFVITKAKQLREESDHCANVVRALAGSTLLLVIRLMLADDRKGIPWHDPAPEPGVGPWPGSAQQVFASVASLLAAASPTIEPLFVKPTPAFLTMYAAEILHVLMHQGSAVPAFRLRDDAARAICELWAPASSPCLPGTWKADEKETLAVNFVGALIDLNLSLPPDPEARHTPVTLGEGGGDIVLGWDGALSAGGSGGAAPSRAAPGGAARGPLLPAEVSRLLSQSTDCLKWNAALSLYALGVDLSAVCHDGFEAGLARWRKRKEQARVLIATDLRNRAGRAQSQALLERRALQGPGAAAAR